MPGVTEVISRLLSAAAATAVAAAAHVVVNMVWVVGAATLVATVC